MFIDAIKVKFVAGKGGNGIVAFKREKFVSKGGPYGGNGGRGGSIIISVDEHLLSLERFIHKRIIKAEDGHQGGINLRRGRNGQDLMVKVPIGTILKDEEGSILFEFTNKNDKFTVCNGGNPGRGNFTFKSPTNQAPNTCTLGKKGEEKNLLLDLKLIADVGFVGFPNAGKSTILKKLTQSKVKIAAYPFTTLHPNLGVLEFDDYTNIFLADIPGIIKDAHLNKGLGLAFLKHIERTHMLLFVIDSSLEDPFNDFEILINEIKQYNEDLLKKPFLTVLNKIDLANPLTLKDFIKKYPFPKDSLIEISAENGIHLDLLTKKLHFLKDTFKNENLDSLKKESSDLITIS